MINNTLEHGAYYVFERGRRHTRPPNGGDSCFSMVLLDEYIAFADSEKADIVIMFAACDGNGHIEEGIRAIIEFVER